MSGPDRPPMVAVQLADPVQRLLMKVAAAGGSAEVLIPDELEPAMQHILLVKLVPITVVDDEGRPVG